MTVDRQDLVAFACVAVIGVGLALIHPGLLVAALGILGLFAVASQPDEEAS